MLTNPADVDVRNPAQVLRLRLRDWVWPAAIAVAMAIAFLGGYSGTYRVGSITYYANVYGLPLFVAALAFAGIRWFWIGRPGPGDPAWWRLPVRRLLLDLPGLLAAGSAAWIVAMVILGLLGIIDLD
ncbi:MAG: hypothetical protein ACYTCU_08700 [Planctomycetota bacterium]|jgi:hypothetical protein